MPEDPDDIIHGEPSKAFFIEMLTRDITATQCILDLVDNSIHNLIRESNIDVMNLLLGTGSKPKVVAEISIVLSKTQFLISDTCDGITIKDARDDVFRHGNPSHEKDHTGLGVSGIGMKRAFFKLGRSIRVESRTSTEEFLVVIDVDKWKRKKDDWSFRFEYARPRVENNGVGTTIIVKKLSKPIGRLFELASFRKELMRKLGSAYALFLKAGLKLFVNHVPVPAEIPEFKSSENLKPVRRLFRANGVDVLLLAGITPMEDRQPRGWYIFCNGRMVVEADRTSLTGWGENLPQHANKYNHFLGLVYFRSTNLLRLPWTTTKDGVERESAVYQRALSQMAALARPVLNFLSDMYAKDLAIEGKEQLDLIQEATKISVESLARSANTTWKAKPRLPKSDQSVTISYKRATAQVERVKSVIGKKRISNKEVGEFTFDYYLRKEG